MRFSGAGREIVVAGRWCISTDVGPQHRLKVAMCFVMLIASDDYPEFKGEGTFRFLR